MGQVFISYASEDRSRAKTLAQALEERGFSTWWDRKIPFGRAYDEVIAESLAQAQCVLVLWTDLSVESRWVRSEASEAAAREILIPVLMERNVKIPLEFKLLQAADLCDWQGDPAYPELQVLVAQIESRLRQTVAGGATTDGAAADGRQATPGGRGEARQTSPGNRPSPDAHEASGAGTDLRRKRRKKLSHFVGFILVPSVAIVAAAALAMTWRLPTRVQLDLVVNRVAFTLSGNQAVDVPANALSFDMLSVENFDKVAFNPKRLRVQQDAAADTVAWKDAAVRGAVVLSGTSDERPLLTIEPGGGSIDGRSAGRLQPLAGKPGTRVTLEARSGSSPRVMLRMDGQDLQTNLLPDGEVYLAASHATIEGAGGLGSGEGEIALQVTLREDDPYMQLQGARRFFVVTAAVVAGGALPLVDRADVKEIEFLRQGPGGSIESALVAAGELSYPGQPGIARKPLAPGDFVGLDELSGAAITRLQLRPDRAGIDLRLDGVAGKVYVSSGGGKKDLRVTALDALWYSAQAAVLVSIAAWALCVSTGAYRLYRDFATA
jgi:hypothetical protein